MNKELLTCEECGKTDDTVEYVIEPYAEEITGETIWINMCRDCYREACQDI